MALLFLLACTSPLAYSCPPPRSDLDPERDLVAEQQYCVPHVAHHLSWAGKPLSQERVLTYRHLVHQMVEELPGRLSPLKLPGEAQRYYSLRFQEAGTKVPLDGVAQVLRRMKFADVLQAFPHCVEPFLRTFGSRPRPPAILSLDSSPMTTAVADEFRSVLTRA